MRTTVRSDTDEKPVAIRFLDNDVCYFQHRRGESPTDDYGRPTLFVRIAIAKKAAKLLAVSHSKKNSRYLPYNRFNLCCCRSVGIAKIEKSNPLFSTQTCVRTLAGQRNLYWRCKITTVTMRWLPAVVPAAK